jgi:hypothetical protein
MCPQKDRLRSIDGTLKKLLMSHNIIAAVHFANFVFQSENNAIKNDSFGLFSAEEAKILPFLFINIPFFFLCADEHKKKWKGFERDERDTEKYELYLLKFVEIENETL